MRGLQTSVAVNDSSLIGTDRESMECIIADKLIPIIHARHLQYGEHAECQHQQEDEPKRGKEFETNRELHSVSSTKQ
jgi:hypothetical protein